MSLVVNYLDCLKYMYVKVFNSNEGPSATRAYLHFGISGENRNFVIFFKIS